MDYGLLTPGLMSTVAVSNAESSRDHRWFRVGFTELQGPDGAETTELAQHTFLEPEGFTLPNSLLIFHLITPDPGLLEIPARG